jgi:squalene-associated FAD-dependent desaturase
MSQLHIIGAGLAGLSCAVRLAARGDKVTLYESANQAGGRCRSLYDEQIERQIDNGNHMLLGGNQHAFAYLREIGALDTLETPDEPAFPFRDLKSGKHWTLRLNPGRIPWWFFAPSRRVPESQALDYLEAMGLAFAGPDETVTDRLDPNGRLFKRFWEPFAVAVLNTAAEEGSARLLWAVVKETFLKGGEACRPYIAREGLSASFIDPAIAYLERHHCPVRLGQRLRGLRIIDQRVVALEFADSVVELGEKDGVVLALPPAAITQLLPDIPTPGESRAIVNAHFRLNEAPAKPDGIPFIGIVGGQAQWIFLRDDVVSITVSAGDALAESAAEDIAALLWAEVAKALELPDHPPPPYRIIKERRATIAQTPEAARQRPGAQTDYANLLLAGDWTDTGIPATIEGAIRSGETAAELAAHLAQGTVS